MEPRADKIRRARMEKRSKLFKAFSASTALSSMILGGAQLASPTYAQFNDTQDQEIEIGACFIFPKVIEEDYREKSVKLSEEAVEVAKTALEEGDKLKAEKAASFSMDSIDDGGGNGSFMESGEANTTGNADDGLGTQLHALESQKEHVQSQLIAVNSKIAAIEKAQQELEVYSQKIEHFLNETLATVKLAGDQKLKEIEELTHEMEADIAGNIRSRATSECRYIDDYFKTEIYPDMDEAVKTLFKTLEQLKEGEGSFKDILTQNEKSLETLQKSLEESKKDSAALESKISSINSDIRSLREKIEAAKEKAAQEKAAAKEKAEKEQADKNKEQTPPATKPDDKAKPDDQQTTPPADGQKDDSSAGDQKDASADKPADNGKPADAKPDAGAGSGDGKGNTTDADQDTDAGQASDAAAAGGSDDSTP